MFAEKNKFIAEKMGKASYTINENQKSSEKTNANGDKNTTPKPEAGKFRTLLPQILASSAKNLLLFDLGLSVAFPTIVIPALRRTIVDPAHAEPLFFTDSQASWFGSIPFICQPIGSVLSGWVSEPLGRKKAMIVVNIPHIIAWIMLYYGTSLEVMYIGAILLGLGVGFMEAPIITYVGEICQPSIRGILISCAGVAVTFGLFVVYLLGSITDWRTAAGICLAVPLFTVVAICFVPETPMWLLSKKRNDDALKSLQWLRGWVSPAAVDKEFNEMIRYNEISNKCTNCEKANIHCSHPPPSIMHKLKELKRKRTLKAFMLVMSLFALGQFNGVLAMRPYLVQLFKAYRVPIDPSWGTVIVGVVAVVANITCMTFVKVVGKRRICLFGYFGSLICCIGMGSYAQTVFPSGYNSFDMKTDIDIPVSSFPLVAYLILQFCTNGGVTSTPWMLLSEVFPFKSRGLATGITAALNYVLGFITTKTYLNLDKGLALSGAMWFYTAVNLIGLVFVYYYMPETENRTLEDIEMHFSENDKKLTDIKIPKISSISRDIEIADAARAAEEAASNNPTKIEENGCDNKAFSEN